jgi:hypothetical protein
MSVMQDRDRLLKALGGKRGVVGVRVQLGRPAIVCVDVSPSADVGEIIAVVRDERVASPTEIVEVGARHVAKALVAAPHRF